MAGGFARRYSRSGRLFGHFIHGSGSWPLTHSTSRATYSIWPRISPPVLAAV